MDKVLMFLAACGVIYFAIVSLVRQYIAVSYNKALYPLIAIILVSMIGTSFTGSAGDAGRSTAIRLLFISLSSMIVVGSYLICRGVIRIIEKSENSGKKD